MEQQARVRALIATMLRQPTEQLSAETSLKSLDNSLGGTRLRLGLKRLGLPVSFERTPANIGQLESLLSRGSLDFPGAPSIEQLAPVSEPSVGDFKIGHDIQDIDSMPTTTDYWNHEFYTGSFSSPEIAYAVVLSEPKVHFAGFWAAKEALKKSEPSLLTVQFNRLTVAHNADGSPFFLYESTAGAVKLPQSLSISHTARTVSAVVLNAGLRDSNRHINGAP